MKDATFSAAWLLELYDRISDAEDAIPRLRRFVLDLAVRGKLVEQDAGDEPASNLLERIAQEKAKGKKGAVELPEAESPETLGKIPLSWAVVPLIGIGSWAIGSGFPKSEQGIGEGPYFFLKVSDMNLEGNEKFITVSNNYIDDDAAQRMRAKIHPAGTIIFPKIGGAIATNKRRILTREAAIDNNCLGITFASEINLDWAFLLMTSIDLTEYQVGTAVPALQQGVLEKIAVAFPPLAEQHRIVAKVDELMALCDQLEQARAGREAVRDRLTTASLARLTAHETDAEAFQSHARFALQSLPNLTTRPDQIKTLRQTILNLAVQGKLVAQDGADEPAEELLKQIQPYIKKQSDRPKSDDKHALPRGWAWATIDELSDVGTGVTPSKSEPAYHSNGTVPWVNSAATNSPIIASVETFVTERAVKECRLKIYPQGSLVVALYGQGKTRGQVAELRIAATVNQACAVIVLPEGFQGLRSYIHLSLKKQYVEMRSLAEGGAQPNLNLGKIKSLPIPLPPLAEQYRIVAKVDALMALCDQLEASLTTTATTRSKLLNALLYEALTPNAEAIK